jgi:predicted KAP-like P-loop ATPase
MIIISYKDKQYYGINMENVFNKFWRVQKGKKTYSNDKLEFIENMFNAAIMCVINRRFTENKMKKMREDNTKDGIEESFNACIDAIPGFINSLQEHNYLQPVYLFAFTKATDFFYFIKLGNTENDQLASALQDIKQILPKELDII